MQIDWKCSQTYLLLIGIHKLTRYQAIITQLETIDYMNFANGKQIFCTFGKKHLWCSNNFTNEMIVTDLFMQHTSVRGCMLFVLRLFILMQFLSLNWFCENNCLHGVVVSTLASYVDDNVSNHVRGNIFFLLFSI